MVAFAIDPDIGRARTLPARFYLDDEVFAALRERVFARSWQWLGDTADLAQPGALSPRLLAPGLLDVPVLLTRDFSGRLHALSNVCTHRGHLLVDTPCRRDDIRCPYHSRRFDHAGRVSFAPGFEDLDDFPSDGDHLPLLPFGCVAGHAFAALQPAMPLDDLTAPLLQRLGRMPLERFVHDPQRDRDFTVRAHWALYVENYLEGLHIPFVHPALARAVRWPDYRCELQRFGNLQLAWARDGEPAFDELDAGRRVAAWYWWLFPNLMLNFYPWGLSLNLVLPQSPALTRVVFRAYVHDANRLEQGAGAGLDQVESEDEAVVESVQRGLRSRLYRDGRYAPGHERGVHQFHRLLCEFLA